MQFVISPPPPLSSPGALTYGPSGTLAAGLADPAISSRSWQPPSIFLSPTSRASDGLSEPSAILQRSFSEHSASIQRAFSEPSVTWRRLERATRLQPPFKVCDMRLLLIVRVGMRGTKYRRMHRILNLGRAGVTSWGILFLSLSRSGYIAKKQQHVIYPMRERVLMQTIVQ